MPARRNLHRMLLTCESRVRVLLLAPSGCPQTSISSSSFVNRRPGSEASTASRSNSRARRLCSDPNRTISGYGSRGQAVRGERPQGPHGAWLDARDLAHAAGLAPVQVSRIERGVREVRLTTIARLHRALDVPPSTLLNGVV